MTKQGLTRSDAALKRLEGILERVRADLCNVYVIGEGDRDFHLAVAEATGNAVISAAMSAVHELMGQELWLALIRGTNFATPERWQQTFDEHWSVYQAIELQQPRLAFDQMKSHLETVEQMMSEVELGKGHQESADQAIDALSTGRPVEPSMLVGAGGR